jgi:hypothetical protein
LNIDRRLGVKIGTAFALCVALTVSVVGAQAPQMSSGQSAEVSPLVLAFYYTWFDQSTWTPSKVSDIPAQPYVSADRTAMARQVDEAKAAGIDAFVVSWYGPGGASNQTEPNFSALLGVAQERGFKLAVDFETASPFLKGQNEIVAALKHVLSVHTPRDAYLKMNDRPVIFFWAIQRVPTAGGQSALDAWRAIRQQVDPDRRSVWIAEGVDIRYQEVFDGHHLYSVAWSKNVQGTLTDWSSRVHKWSQANGAKRLWVATVMPGYNDLRTGRQDAFVADRRDGAFYQAAWQGAIASQADWVIITSFNEWVEGSQIEPSQSYGNRYLDLTRDWAAKFKSGAANAEVAAAASATATETLAATTTMTATLPGPTATSTLTPTATATQTVTGSLTDAPTMGPTAARMAAHLAKTIGQSAVVTPNGGLATGTSAPTLADTSTASPTATETQPATATDTATPSPTDTATPTESPIPTETPAPLVRVPPTARIMRVPPAVSAGLATLAAEKAALNLPNGPALSDSTPRALLAGGGKGLPQSLQPAGGRDTSVTLPSADGLSANRQLTRPTGLPTRGQSPLLRAGGSEGSPSVIGIVLVIAGAFLFVIAVVLAALFFVGSRRRT